MGRTAHTHRIATRERNHRFRIDRNRIGLILRTPVLGSPHIECGVTSFGRVVIHGVARFDDGMPLGIIPCVFGGVARCNKRADRVKTDSRLTADLHGRVRLHNQVQDHRGVAISLRLLMENILFGHRCVRSEFYPAPGNRQIILANRQVHNLLQGFAHPHIDGFGSHTTVSTRNLHRIVCGSRRIYRHGSLLGNHSSILLPNILTVRIVLERHLIDIETSFRDLTWHSHFKGGYSKRGGIGGFFKIHMVILVARTRHYDNRSIIEVIHSDFHPYVPLVPSLKP